MNRTTRSELDALVEDATVDCYGEDEQVSGLHTINLRAGPAVADTGTAGRTMDRGLPALGPLTYLRSAVDGQLGGQRRAAPIMARAGWLALQRRLCA